jgi:hypothetical protein
MNLMKIATSTGFSKEILAFDASTASSTCKAVAGKDGKIKAIQIAITDKYFFRKSTSN